MGRAPTPVISKYIAQNDLHLSGSDSNVYEIPFFFRDLILSDDMSKILVRMLHEDPSQRYQDLVTLREDFIKLKDNIKQTPPILR